MIYAVKGRGFILRTKALVSCHLLVFSSDKRAGGFTVRQDLNPRLGRHPVDSCDYERRRRPQVQPDGREALPVVEKDGAVERQFRNLATCHELNAALANVIIALVVRL